MAYLESLGIPIDGGHVHGAIGTSDDHHTAHEHRPSEPGQHLKLENALADQDVVNEKTDIESVLTHTTAENLAAQIMGILLLECVRPPPAPC